MTRIRLLLILVLALSVVSCVRSDVIRIDPTPTIRPTAVPTLTPTPEGTISYANREYGIQLSYPQSWERRDGRTVGEPLLTLTGPGPIWMLVHAEAQDWDAAPMDIARRDLARFRAHILDVALLREGGAPVSTGAAAYEMALSTLQHDRLIRLLYVVEGRRVFTVQAIIPTGAQELLSPTIERVFQSVRLTMSSIEDNGPRGTLRIWGHEPSTLDPVLVTDAVSAAYVQQLYSGLVRLNSDMMVVPDLATWEVDSSGTTYTFRLKDGAMFSPNCLVRAEDVVYSLNRALDPATKSPTAADYLGDIVGAKDVLAGKAETARGIRVAGTGIVQITIDAPKPYFLAKLTYPAASILHSAVEWTASRTRSPGCYSGPFSLLEWRDGQSLVLRPNRPFKPFDYVGPYVDTVVYSFDPVGPVRLYESGKVDIAPVFLSDLGRVESRSPLKDEVTRVTELSTSYVGFDVTRPPFDDPKVRRAFIMAIDRKKVMETVLDGRYTLAQGLVPPGLSGYAADSDSLPFDPQRARQLIAESKYGSVDRLPPMVLTEAGYLTSGGLTDALVAEWRANLGVEVTVRLLPDDVYYTSLKALRGNLFNFGWIADYPDAQDFLDLLFHTNRENNAGGYSNPTFDALLKKAATLKDPNERMMLYATAERLLVSDAAFIPLYHPVSYYLVKPSVSCFFPDALGRIDLTRIRLNKSGAGANSPHPCF